MTNVTDIYVNIWMEGDFDVCGSWSGENIPTFCGIDFLPIVTLGNFLLFVIKATKIQKIVK